MLGGRTLRYWEPVFRAAACETWSVAVASARRWPIAIAALLILAVPAWAGLPWLGGPAIIVIAVLLVFSWKLANIPARLHAEQLMAGAARQLYRDGERLQQQSLRAVGLDFDDDLIERYADWCRRTEAILARRSDEARAAFAASDAQEQAQIAGGSFGYQGTRRIDLRRRAIRKRLAHLQSIVGDAT